LCDVCVCVLPCCGQRLLPTVGLFLVRQRKCVCHTRCSSFDVGTHQTPWAGESACVVSACTSSIFRVWGTAMGQATGHTSWRGGCCRGWGGRTRKLCRPTTQHRTKFNPQKKYTPLDAHTLCACASTHTPRVQVRADPPSSGPLCTRRGCRLAHEEHPKRTTGPQCGVTQQAQNFSCFFSQFF
jgi:hypothetical protein